MITDAQLAYLFRQFNHVLECCFVRSVKASILAKIDLIYQSSGICFLTRAAGSSVLNCRNTLLPVKIFG